MGKAVVIQIADLLVEVREGLCEGSWDARREVAEVYKTEYKRDISNHVPVTFRIEDTDTDSMPAGFWGGI